eukprot:m.27696 g.27696  ORF g.27696 m.27696 type:complete len:71 (-) comp13464_c0_seq1:109-321(-)
MMAMLEMKVVLSKCAMKHQEGEQVHSLMQGIPPWCARLQLHSSSLIPTHDIPERCCGMKDATDNNFSLHS